MTEQLIKGKRINPERVGFSQPKILDNGAKLVYVNYNNSKFMVQTPWMNLPWDMNAFTEDKYPKYSITMSFSGMDENEELQTFHDRLRDVEGRIIDGGVENSVAWFKKKSQSREVMENLFTPIIKVSTDKDTGEPDGKYPPTMRVKVPNRDGKWECKVYDNEGNQFRVNEDDDNMDEILVKGARVRGILQCVGLWIASSNYMCQWKLCRAEVDVPSRDGAHSFLPDSDGEDNDDNSETESSGNNPTMLDDSEDDEDELVEKPPSPKPVKKAVKRKVKKAND